MTHILQQLRDNPGSRKRPKRLGLGIGSGKGKTAGRGGKGQTARTGVAIKGFEGGQTPIHRRLPKRGFHNERRVEMEIVNLGTIQDLIDDKKIKATDAITRELLIEAGAIRPNTTGLKLLAKGEFKSKLTIHVHAASASAIAAVEKAGGSVVIETAKKAEKKAPKAKKAVKADAKKTPSARKATASSAKKASSSKKKA